MQYGSARKMDGRAAPAHEAGCRKRAVVEPASEQAMRNVRGHRGVSGYCITPSLPCFERVPAEGAGEEMEVECRSASQMHVTSSVSVVGRRSRMLLLR